jgi:hypothetical protein
MTQEEMVYIGTLELLGSDIEPPEIQECLDKEHAIADPVWGAAKEEERKKREACTA